MARFSLRVFLKVLGLLLGRASQRSENFRAALSADRTVGIETADGVARFFAVADRRFSSGKEPRSDVDLRLRFGSAKQALRVLLSSKRGVSHMLDGMADDSIVLTGNLILFVWFQGRIQEAMPFASWRRRRQRFPGAYTEIRGDFAAGRWIRREAATGVLDPGWPAAAEQRRKLLISRVPAGEEAPKF